MNWYLDALKNYTNFSGKATRQEFWMFCLINLVISLAVGAVGAILGTSILSTLYSLFILIPSIAIGARRLHDINKSGWMLLVGLIPVIGWIWLIILFIKERA